MIYFDHASTSMPKPDVVKNAVLNAMDHCGNPARGAHQASLEALRTISSARRSISRYFNVSKSENVVFTPNATAALNIAIGGITGHILTTAAEHNSVLRPVYRHGNYTIVPVDTKGKLDFNMVEDAIRADTEAMVMIHASNVTGNVYDIATAAEFCHEKQIKLIVDASQSAGLMDIDMDGLGLSALCTSGHKSLCGPQGTGILCLDETFRPHPHYVGGSGSESFSETHPEQMPDRLEAGTQNAHGIAGLAAGIDYVQRASGLFFREADRLSRNFIAELRKMGSYYIYGDADALLRVPVVTINHRTKDSSSLAYQLESKYGIAVRAGVHCAPLLHRAMGTAETGAVRFSFSHLNSKVDLATALTALRALA